MRNSTFEERGKLAVNLEKEANWLSIQRKRQIGCQVKERVSQSPVIIHPTSVSQKKKEGKRSRMLTELCFLFLIERGWVNNHGRLIDSFFKLTANSPLSLNLQPICLFF